jgi:trk system potassium uptake protein TrkA
VALTLAEEGCQVLCIDSDPERVAATKGFTTHSVQADVTDEESLRAIGMREIDVAIVSLGQNMEAAVMVILLLKELGVKEIIAKAVTPLHGRILQKIGADRLVFPERDMGRRVAESLVSPNILEHLEVSKGCSVVELVAPGIFAGRSIRDLAVRSRYGVTIVAIRKKGERGERTVMNPGPEEVIDKGDILVIIGHDPNLNKLKGE